MKAVRILTVAAAVAIGLGGLAIAHGLHRGSGHGGMDPVAATKHFAEVYPKFAVYDANHNGQLDPAELQAIGVALRDGSLQLPMPGQTAHPDMEALCAHLPDVFAKVAVYDANHDGVLDATEQAAIQHDLETGALVCPMGDQQPNTSAKSLHSWHLRA